MEPRKLNVLIANHNYGGNGSLPCMHPAVTEYLLQTVPKIKADPRVGRVSYKDLADTPVTMVRNAMVLEARRHGFDVLFSIDSDMFPDYELSRGDPTQKPFWESSFDFLYNHWDKGPVVIGAPYGGPPPHENVFCFQWVNFESNDPNERFKLEQISRDEAARRIGIEETAALPTGVILWDIRCFDLIEPLKSDAAERIAAPWIKRVQDGDDRMTPTDIKAMVHSILEDKERSAHSFYYYEYEDKYEAAKASTEDVTVTRDVALAGLWKLGYNPVHVNWDAWAGHIKQKIVGKPFVQSIAAVGDKLRKTAREGLEPGQAVMVVNSDIADKMDWTDSEILTLPERFLAGKIPEPTTETESEQRACQATSEVWATGGVA